MHAYIHTIHYIHTYHTLHTYIPYVTYIPYIPYIKLAMIGSGDIYIYINYATHGRLASTVYQNLNHSPMQSSIYS